MHISSKEGVKLNISIINNILMAISFFPLSIFYFDNFGRRWLCRLGIGFLLFSFSLFLTGIFEHVYNAKLVVYLPPSIQIIILITVIAYSSTILYSIAEYLYIVAEKQIFILTTIWMTFAIIFLFHPNYLFRIISISFLAFITILSYTAGDEILSLSTLMISLAIISTIFGGFFIVPAILTTDAILLVLSAITVHLFIKHQPIIIMGKDLPRLQIFSKGRIYTIVKSRLRKAIIFHKYEVEKRDSRYIIKGVREFNSLLEALLYILEESVVLRKIAFEKDRLIFEKEIVLNPRKRKKIEFNFEEKMIRSIIGISLAMRSMVSLEFGGKNILIYPVNLAKRIFYIAIYRNVELDRIIVDYIDSILERGE